MEGEVNMEGGVRMRGVRAAKWSVVCVWACGVMVSGCGLGASSGSGESTGGPQEGSGALEEGHQGAAGGGPTRRGVVEGASGAPGEVDGAGLRVKVNGAPVSIRSVLSYSRGGAATLVRFSSADLGCESVKVEGRRPEEGEVSFELLFAPVLNEAGQQRARIARASFNGFSQSVQEKLGEAREVTLDPVGGSRGALSLSLKTPGAGGAGASARELEVEGPFEAVGCGEHRSKRDEGLRVRPQASLSYSLSGQVFEVRGAVLRPGRDGGQELSLSTAAMSCEERHSDEGLQTRLNFVEGGAVSFVYLGGVRIPRQINVNAGLSLRVETQGAGAGGGLVKVKVTGPAQDIDGYRLKVVGEVEALRCGGS